MRALFALTLFSLTLPAFAAVEMKEVPGKVRVEIGGQLFTEYCFSGAPHVYFHPLIGPGGERMTRDWPMKETPGEARDHPHHRSLWFSHGLVNGVDFWTEQKTRPTGRIEHEKFLEVKGGENEGMIRDRLRWVAPDGSVPLTSVQVFRVQDGAERIIDFSMTLTAGEKDVVLGDTKEGTMALRIAESMRLRGPDKKPGAGKIVNSAGATDGTIIGKTIQCLQERYNVTPDSLLAAISPSLGPCCAEFIHYRKELPDWMHEYQVRPHYFDFWAISRRQLLDAGVLPAHIDVAALCTCCNPQFFSYRRATKTTKGITGRNGSIIGLPAAA